MRDTHLTRRVFLTTSAAAVVSTTALASLSSSWESAQNQAVHGSIGTMRHAYIEFLEQGESSRVDAITRILHATGLMESPTKVSVLGGIPELGTPPTGLPKSAIITAFFSGNRSIVVAPSQRPRPAVIRGASGTDELIDNADATFKQPYDDFGSARNARIEALAVEILDFAATAWRTATYSPNLVA